MLEFFKDAAGQYSMNRLLSFVLVISGIVYAFIHPDEVLMVTTLIGAGMAGKVGQKAFGEKKW